MDPIIMAPETYRPQQGVFPNVLAVPREISLPPLKFVVSGSPRIYFIPNDKIQTYEALKQVVAERLEIGLEVVLDMYGDCVDEDGWPGMAFSWPYYTGKFTVIGAPLFSESLLIVEFKPKRLAIKLALPRPHNLTVGCLCRIVVEYMRQLRTAGELAAVGLLPSDLATLYIEGATSGELVQGLLNRKASDGTACTFIAVKMQLIKFPDKREPTEDILMAAATTISQVKSSVERCFFEALRVDHDAWKDEMIGQHDVVVRSDGGHWTEVPDSDETTL
ncbi:hypothetical protein FN846DRAFT_902261 [Sphaerosporella brunnea]|uniref:Uncharacterized protein n=1 Tax=Sphaerosporella brunnea TaxID=1250544 RepID=A0A5J5FB73_9PEZI|nr:hypothetical protein FN846DRAFT_902261 [Sphaerosporella brunnea]